MQKKTLKFIGVYLLMISCVFILGCSTLLPQGDYVTRDVSKTFRISINSNPKDADVYLNDKLLGKTPLINFPIKITYKLASSGVFFANTGWRLHCPQCLKYSLIVKKEGYSIVSAKLQFKGLDRTGLELEKNKYDFLLVEQSK